MNYSKFSTLFSPTRIHSYFMAAQKNQGKAIILYEENLKVGQAFMPLLSILEVTLRNKLYETLSNYLNNKHWIINPSDPTVSAIFSKDYLRNEVNTLKKKGCVTCNELIASVTFGFWIDFFWHPTNKYQKQNQKNGNCFYVYKALNGEPIKIFGKLPKGYNSRYIHQRLSEIRNFRNRLYHNEPIIISNKVLDFKTCEKIHDDILEILKLLDEDLLNFIKPLDNVTSYIALAKQRVI